MNKDQKAEAIIQSFSTMPSDAQENLVYDLYQLVQTGRAKEIVQKEQEIADLKRDILRMDDTIENMKGGRERVVIVGNFSGISAIANQIKEEVSLSDAFI